MHFLCIGDLLLLIAQVGIIGCATVFSGMLGCVVLSILVDKTDCYKSALVITSACAGLFMLALYFNMRADNFETLSFCVCQHRPSCSANLR